MRDPGREIDSATRGTRRLLQRSRCLLTLATAILMSAAVAISATAAEKADDDRIALMVTGWGSIDGAVREYPDYIVARSIIGERTPRPDAPCTQWHVGTFPWRSEKGLVPFATAYRTEGFESLWDGFGVWRLSADGTRYVSVYDETLTIGVAEVDESLVTPMSRMLESGVSSMRALELAPDPRDGTDHLAGIVHIAKPNGLHDVREMALVRWLRIWKMMGQDFDAPPRLHQASAGVETFLKSAIPALYRDRVALRFGYYAPVAGVTREIGDVAVELAREGFDRLVIARETTDHNTYANTFWDLYHTLEPLCRAGFAEDAVDIAQVRQVGRTPEYNALLVENLRRHLALIEEGAEVALLYTTYGLPWPGGNPAPGPFSAPHPFVREVYHENAYLNFLSFRSYAEAALGDQYRIVFDRSGGQGSPNSRSRSLYAYGLTESERVREAGDESGYRTLREVLEIAQRNDGRKEIIVVLSHWFDNTQNTVLDLRLMNDIPLNSIAEMRAGTHHLTWCERYTGPQAYEQQRADAAGRCPAGWARLQITEAFDRLIELFSQGYLQRIRGGLERFGVFPDLDIEVLASGAVSARHGGMVAVDEGPLSGARLHVPADPKPGAPENWRWADAVGPDATVRPILDYRAETDFLAAAWDDFTGIIGTQRKLAPGMPVAAPAHAVSPVVMVGPYRTLFNAPARITLPVDSSRLQGAPPRPMIFNHVTARFEPVLPVAGGRQTVFDRQAGLLSFDTQVLGLFVAVSPP